MAKDPAFLFYPGDWLGGTMTFNRHHKGAYIDLLMAQFNSGPLSLEDIRDILKEDFSMWDLKLKSKFKIDSEGKFFNQKLFEEQSKRKSFSESRRNNLSSETHMNTYMSKHMVIVNEVVNENKIYIESKDEFKKAFLEFMIYRIEIKKPYKTVKSLNSQLMELKKFSDEISISMIKKTISNQWQGIFELKNNNYVTTSKNQPVTEFKSGGPGQL